MRLIETKAYAQKREKHKVLETIRTFLGRLVELHLILELVLNCLTVLVHHKLLKTRKIP